MKLSIPEDFSSHVDSGANIPVICAIYGVDRVDAARWFQRSGVPLSRVATIPPGIRLSPERKEFEQRAIAAERAAADRAARNALLLEDIRSGMSRQDVAAKYHITAERVRQIMVRHAP